MLEQLSTRLYECKVVHERFLPRRHRFSYGIYMLYVDLDELETLDRLSCFFSVDKPNLVGFYQSDHLKDSGGLPLIDRLRHLVRRHGIEQAVEKAYLLTMPRILGYVFNPVSFYFLYGANKNVIACVVEVGNTFNEMKTYVIGANSPATSDNRCFRLSVPKHFYVSPFGSLSDNFDFILPVPDERLRLCINTVSGENKNEKGRPLKILVSSLSGEARPFSQKRLLFYFVRYPLLTLKVIGLIHWQAFLLLLKRIPFFPKEENPQLQVDVTNAHNSLKKRKIHV